MRGASQTFRGTSRFDVRGRLGDGGGGVVYRAFDRKLCGEVALKLMHQREGDDLTHFRRAFPALQRLSHPNLMKLYDLVDEDDQLLLVMELIEGTDLLHYVRSGAADAARAFDELRVRAAFGQLALGLSALHRERKVHRDVKPANVRVTLQGRVVLLDLDFVLDLDVERTNRALGHAPRPMGTAMYMAPEQASSLRMSAASDWYSVGVVLYEALTGVRPYHGSDLEVLLEKQESRPVPPGQVVTPLPVDLETLCVDLLAPDPRERPRGPEILRRLGVPEDVLSARWTSAALLSVRPPFVGRSAALTQIESAFTRARAEPVVLRVSGPAGVGKSSLGEEARRRVRQIAPDALMLSSVCPRYPDRPHAPLHEPITRLAEALRGDLRSVRLPVSASALRLLERAFVGAVLGLEAKLPGRAAAPPEPIEQRWRAIAALRTLFIELTLQRPVVLWLDDYHWADLDTQHFVASLMAGPDAPRMLLLLSHEPEPGSVHASRPFAHETIELANLPLPESRLLIDQLLERAGGATGPLDAALRPQLSALCLPLLIRERVRHALLFGELPRDDETLPDLIAHRLAQLPDRSRRVLEVVCAGFDAMPQAVCELASELSPADFTREVSALTIAGLLCSTMVAGEDALAPSHTEIAELVDSELRGPRRVRVHKRIAGALATRDATRAAGRLLRHRGESGDHARAADSALLAAEQAYEALAFQRAAELQTLCASLKSPGQDEAGQRTLRRMADTLAHAGWLLSAAGVYREASRFASAADALHMHQRALECLLRGGEVEEGEQALAELLGRLGEKLLSSGARALWSLRAQHVRSRLFGLSFRDRPEAQLPPSALREVDALFACGAQLTRVDALRGAELLARALVAARALGEPMRVARALCTESWNCIGTGNHEQAHALALLDAARVISEQHDAPLLDGHLRLAQGMLALSSHQVRECSTHFRDAERVFRDSCADVDWELGLSQVHQLFALSLQAQYGQLAPKLALLSHEAEERGDVWTHTALLGVEALGLALAEDAPDLAEERVLECNSRWRARETLHMQALCGLLASTSIDLYRREAFADDRLERRLDEVDARDWQRVGFVRVALLELRARARLHEAVRRRDLSLLRSVEQLTRTLRATHEPAALGFAHALLANVHVLHGDQANALRALEHALSLLHPMGLDQWAVPVRLAIGHTLGGERGAGIELAARDQLTRLGVRHVSRYVSMMLPAFKLD